MRKFFAGVLLLVGTAAVANKTVTVDGWRIVNAEAVSTSDSAVSTVGFDCDSWHRAEDATTVLNALVKDGTYPDPRTGMNNFLIPDVSDDFNARLGLSKYSHLADGANPWKQPWYYRTEIALPRQYKGKRLWLNLDGINYRADVWLNGRKVADRDTTVGMFRRFRYDVTDIAKPGANNALLIKIYQVDHPGEPSPGTQFVLFGPNRGNAGDIHRDETLKMSGGWDCAPVVRDRNMGVYMPVWFEATGDVALCDPYVETSLNDDYTQADVEVTVPIQNLSDKPLNGRLTAVISSVADVDMGTHTVHQADVITPIKITRQFHLDAGGVDTLRLTSDDYKALSIQNPPLWYPNGYGEQPIQHISVRLDAGSAGITNWESDFAIREVKTHLMPRQWTSHLGEETEYGLVFTVNGIDIFSRGGWIQPDILLDNSRRNIYDQIRLIANTGANTIGSEDMPAPSQHWLDACDRYGIMWWHVFHQCYRMFPGRANQNNPDDHSLAVKHVEDQIRRYRNHPCVVAWVGVNEVCPAEDLYEATKEAVYRLDSTRHYIPTTSTSWDVDSLTPWLAADMPIGTTDDGAPDYNWAPSDYYFDKIGEVYTQMFKNELGMPAPPVYENLVKFIPTLSKEFDERDRLWPLDSVWAHHGAWCVNNFVYRGFDNAIRTFYSDPVSARDYALKAQLLSADGYRAMIEAANHRAWDITTGVMLWKLNSCWPDVAWQVYDWYLTPNAAYYFAKKAMEPVHVQLNANTETIAVINNTPVSRQNMIVEARIDDFFGKKVWEKKYEVSVSPNSYCELGKVPSGGRLAAVYLVTLTLRDGDGKEISHNTYWRYSQHQNFYWLMRMPQGELTSEVVCVNDDDEYLLDITLSCDDSGFAFFKHLTLGDSATSPSVDPVIWSDNFVTLLPGETRHYTARVARDLFSKGQEPVLRIE